MIASLSAEQPRESLRRIRWKVTWSWEKKLLECQHRGFRFERLALHFDVYLSSRSLHQRPCRGESRCPERPASGTAPAGDLPIPLHRLRALPD